MTAPEPETPPAPDWYPRLLEVLERYARERRCIAYAELAAEAAIPGPKAIHKLTEALERLVSRDHAEGRPLRAAVVVSKSGRKLPAPGFFQHCAALGLYFGPDRGAQAELFHRLELDRLFVNDGIGHEDL
ncbi:hypothetical protein NUH88_05870 [Nisaea acidiphila]|uniref:Uncharacterized protein n=1 Tax=Nisaea acidiphila TaxID=1862145 RepID=A0A9J7AV60_9PROT|nr:hypothetical protein [Nisaea acidiphila]UUX51216.1 hypothetical protein NUH88_05870 [Nisaea acidiphila]